MSETPQDQGTVLLLDEDGEPICTVPAEAVVQKDGYVEINTALVPSSSATFTKKVGYWEVRL